MQGVRSSRTLCKPTVGSLGNSEIFGVSYYSRPELTPKFRVRVWWIFSAVRPEQQSTAARTIGFSLWLACANHQEGR